MSDKTRKDLERWVRQQVFRQRETPLAMFVLKSGTSRGGEIDVVEVPSDCTGDNVGLLVEDIIQKLQTDADSMGTKVQRYFVMACEVGSKTGTRYPIRIRGEGEEDDVEEADQPTEKGLTSQLMRHNEALMRMLVMTTGTQVTAMSRRLEANERTMERLMEERRAEREALEAAKDLQHERDMHMLTESGKEERKNAMMKKVESLLPVVINKIAGKPVLPDTPEANMVRHMVASFTPEQLQAMAPILSQEQQIMLLTLLKEIREQEAKEQAS